MHVGLQNRQNFPSLYTQSVKIVSKLTGLQSSGHPIEFSLSPLSPSTSQKWSPQPTNANCTGVWTKICCGSPPPPPPPLSTENITVKLLLVLFTVPVADVAYIFTLYTPAELTIKDVDVAEQFKSWLVLLLPSKLTRFGEGVFGAVFDTGIE